MSWFQSLKDDFTLKPFEIQDSTSESAAVASGPPDVMANQEPAEVEECSGRKKSKFQSFKKFFTRRKRKEPSTSSGEAGLKASKSSDNINRTPENTLTRSEKDKGSGSKISLGSKALSHDSVFVSDSLEAAEALGASQDSIHGKVKSLQLQLKQAIRLGSPPSIMCVKKAEDVGTMSEDDGLPCSPPELHTLHTVLNPLQRNGSLSMEGTDSDEDQLSGAASSRAVSPLVVVPGDFSQPASPFVCLDNSAAKHKLGLRHKACNRRKPSSRLDVREEGDSVNEGTSIHEQLEERLEREDGDVCSDLLDAKKEEGEEELDQAQHYKQSLLGDTQEEEAEEQDVSHAPDVSSPPDCNREAGFPAEEEPDAPSPASSQPSSRASSVAGTRPTPEPPAGDKEYFLDSPGFACGSGESSSELVAETNIGEEGAGESGGEESSFLQEVLSSLKTPLNTYSLGLETEETREAEEEQRGEAETEEVKADETEEAEAVREEEEEGMAPRRHAPSCQAAESVEEEEEEEEGDAEVIEGHMQHSDKEEVQEVRPEYCTDEEEDEYDMGSGEKDRMKVEEEQSGETEVESEGEEEAIEVVEEAIEVVEEAIEVVEGAIEVVEGAVETAEDWGDERMEESEDLTEADPRADDTDRSGTLELDERDDHTTLVVGPLLLDPAHIPVELCEEPLATVLQSHTDQTSVRTSEDIGDTAVEMDTTELISDLEEDVEIYQLDVEPTCNSQAGAEKVQVSVEQDRLEVEKTENDQNIVAFEPLSVLESQGDLDTREEGDTTAASTETGLGGVLVSSGSQQASSPLQQSADTTEEDSKSATSAADTAKENEPVEPQVTTKEEEQGVSKPSSAGVATKEEESRRPPSLPDAEEETVKPPDGCRPRYTITPAWQRSLSTGSAAKEVTPPSSPSPCLASIPTPPTKAEVVCTSRAEVVLSPSRPRSVGAFPAKPQSSAAAPAEESQVIAEGNPENPFGVRLRKTAVLRRFSTEEESGEFTYESQGQPTDSKTAHLQPIGVKPTLSQPVGIKPALPKKPEVQGDSGEKPKPTPELFGSSGPSGSDSPSWISVARKKQRIYKDSSLNTSDKKEEPERKSSLPLYVSSAACREHSKTSESSSKGSLQETAMPEVAVEKEGRRPFSPPTPVPPQFPKSQLHPCHTTPKPSTQPTPTQRALYPPSPATVSQRGSSSFAKSPLPHPGPLAFKPPQPQTSLYPAHSSPPQPSLTLASPPFPPRTTSAPSGANTSPAPGPSGTGQRGLPMPGSPPTALPQDEPPWMALAKKKAKAWSEMPQIVQ